MTAHPVDVSDLRKAFGSVTALDGLHLTVRAGEVAGFLGPNGAGKSTTIRVLLGLHRADSGVVEVLGGDAWSDAVALHRRLAYVPGDVSLWPDLTGGETIDYLTRLHRRAFDGARRRTRKAGLLERYDLDPTKKARTYSKGNRQKVALVAAFLADPELYLFDEPTSGLDPLVEAVFTECVREVRAEGRSVLLSSHVLSEVEKLCDTVTIIRRGRTVESGTIASLRHLTRTAISSVVTGDPAGLAALPGVHDLATAAGATGTRVELSVDDARTGAVLDALTRLGVRSLTAAPPSLEDLFMRHYGGAHEDDLLDGGPATGSAAVVR